MNLRFPDKTSNVYLEYLDRMDTQENIEYKSTVTAETPIEKDMCVHLQTIIGDEKTIRTRQRMFSVLDTIVYSQKIEHAKMVFSGSLAEGLDLPGSDLDIMFVMKILTVNIVPNEETKLQMICDKGYPGFAQLKLAENSLWLGYTVLNRHLVYSPMSRLVTTKGWLNIAQGNLAMKIHGPCVSTTDNTIDIALCLQCSEWPTVANRWIYRSRGTWPSKLIISRIIKDGCLLVPIGPKYEADNILLWRISFSLAEKHLSHAMNYTQVVCYALLKLTLKEVINKQNGVKDLLCSYFLKTALYWVSEKTDIEMFRMSNISDCYALCIDQLITWIRRCYCPNYFIPEHNMFKGKIDIVNNQLLDVLSEIRSKGIKCLFHVSNDSSKISDKNADLRFLLYRLFNAGNLITMSLSAREDDTLLTIRAIVEFESSPFISNICIFHHAICSQILCQSLIGFTSRNKSIYLQKNRYCKHLYNSTKYDAVSGWLLYASFYYKLKHYKTTLEIVNYVLSRCTPDMMLIGFENTEQTKTINIGRYSSIELHQEIKLTCLNTVIYMKDSSLMPDELQMAVKKNALRVSPVALSYFLRFLCYEHLCDVCNQQQALRDLSLTLNEKYFISSELLYSSYVMLGICYKINKNTPMAKMCYKNALGCNENTCYTAKKEK